MLEASKFHRNVNRIFFFPSDQITIPALTSGANVNLKKKRHNQHHRNRDKMRAIPNLPYARTAATVIFQLSFTMLQFDFDPLGIV